VTNNPSNEKNDKISGYIISSVNNLYRLSFFLVKCNYKITQNKIYNQYIVLREIRKSPPLYEHLQFGSEFRPFGHHDDPSIIQCVINMTKRTWILQKRFLGKLRKHRLALYHKYIRMMVINIVLR